MPTSDPTRTHPTGPLRTLGWVAIPSLAYAVALPLLGLHMDQMHGLHLSLPASSRVLGGVLALVGAAGAVWSAGLLVRDGRGTPNPARPPLELVTRGPYAATRNPLMLAGWTFGAGLALALASPSLFIAYACVVLAGVVYVRTVEEPRLEARFGERFRRYAARVPRWLVGFCLLGVGPSHASAQPGEAVPAVVVRIDVAPGGTARWIELFETHIVPSIEAAIEADDEFVDFMYFEGLISSESTDVVLVIRARSFAFFDQRRPFPHYRALYRRLGPDEGGRVMTEMIDLERSVEVTLVRSYGRGVPESR